MQQRDYKTNIRWTWQQLDGMRLRILATCLIGMLRICISLMFVWVCKIIVDVATTQHGEKIWWWIGAMCGVILLMVITSAWNVRVREKNRIIITNHLRQQLFSRVMRARWHGREALHSGDTVNRLEDDIRTLSSTATEMIPAFIIACFQLVAASFVLFTMQKNLLWVLLFIMPLALIVSKIYFRILRRLTAEIREQDSKIQSHMQESLLKRILILSMGREDDSVSTLDDMQDSLMTSTMRRVTYSNRSRVFIQIGFMAGYVVTFCWSAFGLISGAVTYGMMTACLQLVNQVQNPILDMSHYLPALVQSMTSVDRLRELADMQEEEKGNIIEVQGPLGLRIDDLTYTYPGNEGPTIDHLTCDFRPGVSTAIVGETGSGKSTLIRLMMSLLQPDSGHITLYNGKEEYEMSPALRCNFRFVPQGNSLMSGTVRDNLLLGNADATEEEMREALRLAAADFVFERPEGLDTPCSEQGSGLSEGQAQRIAIARALLQKGAIILMDEACSSVDSRTERRILENLSKGIQDKTIIWVTHHAVVQEYMSHSLAMQPQPHKRLNS